MEMYGNFRALYGAGTCSKHAMQTLSTTQIYEHKCADLASFGSMRPKALMLCSTSALVGGRTAAAGPPCACLLSTLPAASFSFAARAAALASYTHTHIGNANNTLKSIPCLTCPSSNEHGSTLLVTWYNSVSRYVLRQQEWK